MNGNELKWWSKVEHLGNTLNEKLNDDDDIRLKCVDFVCKANYILSLFKFVNRKILISLLNIHCSSYYGAIIWDFNNVNVDNLNIRFKNAVRKIFNVPRHSRSSIIFKLSDTVSPEAIIHSRFIKFLHNAFNSNNSLISFMANLGAITSTTFTGRNRIFLERKYQIFVEPNSNFLILKRKVYDVFHDENIPSNVQLEIVKDLIDVRDGLAQLNDTDYEEISDVLKSVITNRDFE